MRFFVVSVELSDVLDGCVEALLLDEVDGWVLDDCVPDAPWPRVDVEFTSVEVWLAEVVLLVVLLPLPMFTPGLTLALAFRSVLLTPTFAFTSRFGFTLMERWLVSDELLLDGVALLAPDMPFATPTPVVVLVLGAAYVLDDDVPLLTVLEPLTLALPLAVPALPLTPPAVPLE